jgi:tetratricopeptide (TPR) repeat protein
VLRLVWVLVLSAAAMIAQDGPAPAVLRKAIELQQTGKYAEAIEAYQALLRAQPDAAGGRSNLGAALAHEGRFAEAIREYTAALVVLQTRKREYSGPLVLPNQAAAPSPNSPTTKATCPTISP